MNEAHKQPGCDIVLPLRPSETVVATVSLLAFIGAMLLLVLFLILPTSPAALIYTISIVSLCIALTLPALACIFYRCNARLVLSETGLRWRTWGDWQRASWDGVQDYWDLPAHAGSSESLMTIQTEAGDVLLIRKWRESEAVRRAVEVRATAAAAAEWGVFGERSLAADTRTFRYGQKDFWITLLMSLFLFLPYTAYGWYWVLRQPGSRHLFDGIWTPGEFWFSLFSFIFASAITLLGLIVLNLPLFIFLALLPGMLETRKRRRERVTTRQAGIVFDNGRRQVSADWDEVTGYFLQPSAYVRSPFFRTTALSSSLLQTWRWVYVVETRQGDFDYSSQIEGKEALGETIKARATPIEARDDPIQPLRPPRPQ